MLHYQYKIAIIQGEKAKKCIFFKKKSSNYLQVHKKAVPLQSQTDNVCGGM